MTIYDINEIKQKAFDYFGSLYLRNGNIEEVGTATVYITDDVKISIRNNAESVQLDDEEQFIRLCLARGKDDYLRYKDPELNRTAIKKALQAGEEIDGAHLIRTQSLTIR